MRYLLLIVISSVFISQAWAIQICEYHDENGNPVNCKPLKEIKEDKKKSKSKPFNLDGFTFRTDNYPLWINWNPEIRNVTVVDLIDMRLQYDKSTSHGYSRNHIQFTDIMEYEAKRASEIYPSFADKIFERWDYYK